MSHPKLYQRYIQKDENLMKIVTPFYMWYIVEKYINTTKNIALYLEEDLKFVCGSGSSNKVMGNGQRWVTCPCSGEDG